MLTRFTSCPFSGNIKKEPGAVVCRMSQSFIRFGTFQLPASRGGEEADMVKMLADFVIRRFYPHLQGEHFKINRYLANSRNSIYQFLNQRIP